MVTPWPVTVEGDNENFDTQIITLRRPRGLTTNQVLWVMLKRRHSNEQQRVCIKITRAWKESMSARAIILNPNPPL